VAAENYHAKAKNFMDLHQREDGSVGVMLDRMNQPTPWDAWQRYFKAKGIKAERMKFCLQYMVPAIYPKLFDGEWA
jgi:hypothetical protein